ncbi:MAG: TolC family protein [Acidiferrobacterales bacterium]
MRRVPYWLTAAVLCASQTALAQEPSVMLSSPGLHGYVREVLDKNTGLDAAGSRLAASIERIGPAGALPNPIVTTGLIAVPAPSFDFTAERMTRVPIGIRQYFPFPGKQSAAADVARADSAVSGSILNATQAGLVESAVAAFYHYAYASTALDVWTARVDLAEQATRLARSRYETGAVPQTDFLRAQLRRAQLEEERRHLEGLLASAEAQLDALRGGSADPVSAFPLLLPTGGVAVDVSVDSLAPDTALARRLAVASPALLVAQAQVERADRSARVHAIAARPDFVVGLESGFRFGGNEPLVTALVGVSVPLWSSRNQAPAARAAVSDAEAASQHYHDVLTRLQGDLRSTVAELNALQDRIAQADNEIIPLASAASTSALQQYAVGTVQFTTVLDAQDDLFRAQLSLARLLVDYAGRRARLATLIGEEWYR